MPYKIQVAGVDGWADLKSTENGKVYEADVYSTEKDAKKELASIRSDIPDFDGRVVTADTVAECDLY